MSNTLKFGSGKWAVKEGSTLAYNDENGNFKPLPFTFNRAGSATVVNKQGLIEVVGNNEPRIDFLNDSKGALLLEPNRSNLVTYSEAFDNSYWTKTNLSVVGGFTSPQGLSNAYKLTEDASNDVHLLIRNFSSSSGSSYTYKIFVKMNGRKKIMLRESGSTASYVSFDLLNNTIIDQSNATGTINKIGNDWFELTHTSVAGITFNIAYFILPDDYVSGQPQTYQGDGTSGFYIFGAQLEQGSYATSYIPTQGAIGTRVAESCNGAGNNQVINSTEGVLFAELSALGNDGTYRTISLNNVVGTNRVDMYYNLNDNQMVFLVYIGDVIIINYTHTFTDATDLAKIAIKWKSGDYGVFVNGIKEATSSSVSAFASNVLTTLNLTNSAGGEAFSGNTKQIQVYNTALTDQELINLTKI